MTAKEKAKEIAMKFDKYGQTDNAVKCALICLDEIIESLRHIIGVDLRLKFWIEVKEEINKI